MKTISSPAHVRLENILLAVDLTTSSQKALAYAASIARQYESKLQLVYVFPGDSYSTVPLPPDAAWSSTGRADRHDAERQMAALREAPLLRGLNPAVRVLEGDPAAVLSALTHEEDLDLAIVGTHGAKGVEKFLLGSVAEEVFRTAQCPVLTVGPGATGTPDLQARMGTILYATDFSPAASCALPYALSLAQEHQSRLVLLHVESNAVGGFSYEQAMISERIKPELAKLVPEDAQPWCKPELAVRFGPVPEAIMTEAAEVQADLIVMGLRGTGALAGLRTHLPGSTAYKVASSSLCPVLTVRR